MALDTMQQNNLVRWTQLSTQGSSPHQRQHWQAVQDNKDQIYLYGGCSGCTVDITTMFIFDTLTYSWSAIVQQTSPNVQVFFSATMLPNGRIIYIGGLTSIGN